MKASAHEIRVGAIYRFAAERGLSADQIATLLRERAGLSEEPIRKLIPLWLTTEPFRTQRRKAFGAEGLRPVEAPANSL